MEKQPKQADKLPRGTSKDPWYKYVEYDNNGNKIKTIYYKFLVSGVWMTKEVPTGVVKV